MNSTETFRREIAAFLERHNMKRSNFSKAATGDPAFLLKLDRGRSPTLEMFDRIRKFMRDYDDRH